MKAAQRIPSSPRPLHLNLGEGAYRPVWGKYSKRWMAWCNTAGRWRAALDLHTVEIPPIEPLPGFYCDAVEQRSALAELSGEPHAKEWSWGLWMCCRRGGKVRVWELKALLQGLEPSSPAAQAIQAILDETMLWHLGHMER